MCPVEITPMVEKMPDLKPTPSKRAKRNRWLLLLALAASVAVTLFFAVRLTVQAVYWSDPTHRDQAIEAWMTPRYVAQSWNIPRDLVGTTLGLGPSDGRRMTLHDIARESGGSVEDLAAALRAAIQSYRAK
jgi:hypothetical protein